MKNEIMLGGNGYYFDVTDPDFVEQYDAAEARLNAAMTERTGGDSETMRHHIAATRTFLDDLFGMGANERILGEKNSLMACWEVCKKIYRTAIEQAEEVAREAAELQELAASVGGLTEVSDFTENTTEDEPGEEVAAE